jgi:outer membrane protein TolC
LLEHRVAALRARERGATRDALPTLDLTGGLEFAGLAGRGRPVAFGDVVIQNDLNTGVGDAWSQVFQGDFPTWNVGLRFAMALGRRSDTGERDRRRAETALGEQQLVGARRGLEETVRSRCRDLEHAERRLALARDGVAASLEQVRIGRLEFENGRTTAFELVRLAGDLASAQQRYSQALVRGAQAAAALRELTGAQYPPAR